MLSARVAKLVSVSSDGVSTLNCNSEKHRSWRLVVAYRVDNQPLWLWVRQCTAATTRVCRTCGVWVSRKSCDDEWCLNLREDGDSEDGCPACELLLETNNRHKDYPGTAAPLSTATSSRPEVDPLDLGLASLEARQRQCRQQLTRRLLHLTCVSRRRTRED
jgi:hypothetical protein